LPALEGVEHFEGKVVAAGGEVADGCADQVICDDGWDRGGESGGGGDERFGNTGSDSAESCAAGGAESVKGVDDAPDGAEESDEGRDAPVMASQGRLRSKRVSSSELAICMARCMAMLLGFLRNSSKPRSNNPTRGLGRN
jgi:hypothetical protein